MWRKKLKQIALFEFRPFLVYNMKIMSIFSFHLVWHSFSLLCIYMLPFQQIWLNKKKTKLSIWRNSLCNDFFPFGEWIPSSDIVFYKNSLNLNIKYLRFLKNDHNYSTILIKKLRRAKLFRMYWERFCWGVIAYACSFRHGTCTKRNSKHIRWKNEI